MISALVFAREWSPEIVKNQHRAEENFEKLDEGIFMEAIGNIRAVCNTFSLVVQFLTYLSQWRNPIATLLAMMVCIGIWVKGWAQYIPTALCFLMAAWMVNTKLQKCSQSTKKVSTKTRENKIIQFVKKQYSLFVLQLVTVAVPPTTVVEKQNALLAYQEKLMIVNQVMHMVQVTFLSCEGREGWIAIGSLCEVGVILLLVPAKVLCAFTIFVFFFQHLLRAFHCAVRQKYH